MVTERTDEGKSPRKTTTLRKIKIHCNSKKSKKSDPTPKLIAALEAQIEEMSLENESLKEELSKKTQLVTDLGETHRFLYVEHLNSLERDTLLNPLLTLEEQVATLKEIQADKEAYLSYFSINEESVTPEPELKVKEEESCSPSGSDL